MNKSNFLQDLTVGVIGAGAMGRGIVQILVQANVTVRLYDVSADAVKEAANFVEKMIQRAADKGVLTAEQASSAIARIQPASNTQALHDCHLIIEAIVERLDVKQNLFKELESIVSADCILASNTSSLSITSIAAGCQHPARVAGLHFFNPVPLMKLVEIIPGVKTNNVVVENLMTLVKHVGHTPVHATDTPGFLVNHAGRAYGPEALRIVSEGIAEFHEIDNIMREAAGFRMGPFELFDLTGLDVSLSVMESIYKQYYEEPRYRPTYIAQQRVTAGLLGRKTGEGFYLYKDNEQQRPAEKSAPTLLPKSIWLSEMDDEARNIINELAKKAKVVIEKGDAPSNNALIIIAPIGQDATTTAIEHSLDANHVVAIDTLFGLSKGRRTLMTTPITKVEYRDAAHAFFAYDGAQVTVINDSPGFIAQRIVAMIINVACEIAQQKIATPADIDIAIKTALAYPQGPLSWGDALGAATILQILEGLESFYGDPRYRPSAWLSRRAALDISLKTVAN
ncbi:MAG: 3-hydroxyacyl-CoA dehydrogenase [Gammaproteobacteria bacterium]|nr:3-hydroxyacyl-CoA dehydrogenase [Gammaproteobacteria bacterium]